MSAPRLSKDTKAEILEAYLQGEPLKSIASRFGVDQSYPGLLAKRKGHGPLRHNMRCVKYRRSA